MKRLILSLLFCIITLAGQAQNSYDNPDSLALNQGITLKKTLTEVTLYDYGQTTMKMKVNLYESKVGNLYSSLISLKTPSNSYELYQNSETTIRLNIAQTKRFIEKLSSLLEIDSMKDSKLSRNVTLSSGERLNSGTNVWNRKKEYSFSISSDNGGSIHFNLLAKSEDTSVNQSKVTGVFITESDNYNYFTVNDYDEYRRRIEIAASSLQSVINSVNNSIDSFNSGNKGGVNGQVISYQPLLKNNYKVLKSDVHNTSDVEVLADVTLKRTPRLIKLNDFKGEFDEYNLVYDEQLTPYVKEEIEYMVFIDELLNLLNQYDATGILDPKIIKGENSIQAKFSIIE